jgi:cation:H+ antiporter
MTLIVAYVLFVVGFVFLVKGADFLVDGSVALAQKAGIKELVIGLTIVSFGTSAPELVINISSSFQNSPQLAIGNILGSNMANIFLILGVSALVYPLTVHTNTVYKAIPFQLLSSVIVFYLAYDILFYPSHYSGLARGDGFILLGFFGVFMYYVFSNAKKKDIEIPDDKHFTKSKFIIYIIIGIAGLGIGSHLIVTSAIEIAKSIDLSERVIGLSIVAIGTSLPELAASVVAASKKNTDLAIGNVIGSNIFNVFWILGVSAVIRPLHVVEENSYDFIINIAASVFLFAVLFIGSKHVIGRWKGVFFLLIYLVYIVFVFYYKK